MSKPKISNRQAHGYVQKHQPFIANNIFAGWEGGERYVVYSYGRHWPMYIWDNQTERWYENVSKYSVTTSKHRSQARPSASTTPLHVEDMIKVAASGITAIISHGGKNEDDPWYEYQHARELENFDPITERRN